MSSTNDFVKTHKVPEDTRCLCDDAECKDLTTGFADLRDARQRFVRLPPRDEANLDSPFYQERNRRREAYLRHVLPNHDLSQETLSEFIALHHFHPTIVKENTRKIPKSLSLGKAVQLKMMLSEKDKVVDENTGLPYFIFVPNYAKNNVKRDLETLVQETEIEDWSDKESEASTVEIPEHISFDEESDVSSIDFILDEETDTVNLMSLVPDSNTFQALLRKFDAKKVERIADAVVERESSKAGESLEETVDTSTELEKEDASKVEVSAKTVIESAEAEGTNNGAKETLYYSFQELKSGVKGVEYTQREQYLSPDEFEKLFGMSKEEFNVLRNWKQQTLKKKVGLF